MPDELKPKKEVWERFLSEDASEWPTAGEMMDDMKKMMRERTPGAGDAHGPDTKPEGKTGK